MRRVIGLTLAGLGAFLIVVAVLLRTYVGGQLIKFPKNEYFTTTLVGTGVSYFSPSMVRPVSGATMRVTSTVKGDAAAARHRRRCGTSSPTSMTSPTGRRSSSPRAASPSTAAPPSSSTAAGPASSGNTAIRQSGLVGFLWPIGTQKTTYQVFDPDLNEPRPARYVGTSTIDGITVYRFVEHVPTTQVGRETLPGSLVGMTGQSMVTLPEYYTGTNTFWVDPLTGAQLNAQQDEKLTLQDATGAQRLLLLDGALIMTPQSVQAVVNLDATGRTEFDVVRGHRSAGARAGRPRRADYRDRAGPAEARGRPRPRRLSGA